MRETIKRILIIEPSVIVAEGVRYIVDNLAEYTVTGILQDLGEDMEITLDDYDADLLVVDPAIFDIRTRTCGKDLIKNGINVPVIALITNAIDASLISAYDGAIYLTDKSDEIEQKLSATMRANPSDQRGDGEELSAREKEILVCVAKGMLNKEIADHFNISIYTVITHRKNITRKTGIKTVAGLTVYALLNNLIDMNTME